MPDARPFGETVRQLHAYFAGELKEFDLPLRLHGTDFQRGVWSELVRIPYGETRSYGELADRLGKPGASRAVGLANGRNPVGIIVPCHRVIGASGEPDGVRRRAGPQAAAARLRAGERVRGARLVLSGGRDRTRPRPASYRGLSP